MSQVNVNYDQLTLAGLDQIAAACRLTRPDLLRLIANEAVEAHHGGRLAFAAEEGPRIDSSLNALAAQLKEAVIELDRVQRHNQSVEQRLHDAHVQSETNILAATDELTRRVNDVNSKSYQPFVQKFREVERLISGIPQTVAGSVKPELQLMTERLASVQELASQPRHETRIMFGDDQLWSIRFLSMGACFSGVVFTLSFLMLASFITPIGIGIANRLLHDSPQVCRLIEERFGTSRCEVPVEEQLRDLRIRKASAGR